MMTELESLKAEAATLPLAIQEAAKRRDMVTMRQHKSRLEDMPMLLADCAIREMEARLAELDEQEPAVIAEARRARQAVEVAHKALQEAWKVASAAEFEDYRTWGCCQAISSERAVLLRRIAQIEAIIDSQNVVTPVQTTGVDSLVDLHWMRDVLKH